MSYWKSKVVPKFKKIFEKGKKKKGAAEVCKSFESSKESLQKEIDEKGPDLKPKVVEIYRSSTVNVQKLLKEPSETAVKDNSDAAQSALSELAKAGFPGAQVLSDAGTKYGPALLPGPVVFVLEKTSTFLTEEPMPEVKEETREVALESVEPANTEEPPAVPPAADLSAEGKPEVAKEEPTAAGPVEKKTEKEAPVTEPIKSAEDAPAPPTEPIKPAEDAPAPATEPVKPAEVAPPPPETSAKA